MQIIAKPEIYVIFDKYEFLCSSFSIAAKFLIIIVSLKMKIIIIILEWSFFTLVN